MPIRFLSRIPRPWRVAGAIVLVLLLAPVLLGPLVGVRLRAMARARGLDARWSSFGVGYPAAATIRGLVLVHHDRGDTLFRADSLGVRIAPLSLLTLHPRPETIALKHAELRLPARAGGDTIDSEATAGGADAADPRRAERVRRSVEGLARIATASARQLPRLRISDLMVRPAAGGEALWDSLTIGWLSNQPDNGGGQLAIAGTLHGERHVPFETSITVRRDGRVSGASHFGFPDADGGNTDLELTLDGRMRAGAERLELDPATRVTIGALPFRLGGSIDRNGPRLSFRFAADGLTQAEVERNLPRSFLGRLRDVGVRGSWDYRLSLDLDLARPDSVRFDADVIPHGLVLDPERTDLNLLTLDRPFVARIHLPHDRIVERELSPASGSFRPLDRIAPALIDGVITNEDGGFFQHRGFNTRAMREAIAEDVKTGSFKRGAGTITMQLVRNLYLGHERTVARKFQEVTLAWVLEHLTGISKERMLEIYLNIVEWGPEVHGAEEAARFYFGRDASELTTDQALFLVTLIPSPARWRGRFDKSGVLRPYVKQQMHFIGRAMIAKGWLAPEALPAADSLTVELAGAARALIAPVATDSPGVATIESAPPAP